MTDIEILTGKIDRLEIAVNGLDKSVIEVRVALLGGLDGRPGLLAQIAATNNSVTQFRNEVRLLEHKLSMNDKALQEVQKQGLLMQGKLIGGGGLLGVALTELIEWFTK